MIFIEAAGCSRQAIGSDARCQSEWRRASDRSFSFGNSLGWLFTLWTQLIKLNYLVNKNWTTVEPSCATKRNHIEVERWKINFFCFIPPSLWAMLEFWYIESGLLDCLWSLVCRLKEDYYSSIYLQMIKILDTSKFSVIPDLNAIGNEIKEPRPFFWLVLRLWRPTRVRFLI